MTSVLRLLAALFLGSFAIGQNCVVGFNHALSFDGVDDLVSIPGFGANAAATDFTLEVWAKCNFGGGGGAALTYLNPSTGFIAYRFGFNYPASAVPVFSINNGPTVLTGNGVPYNTWYHWAIVRSGSSLTLLRDGVVDAIGTTTAGSVSALQLHIGTDYSGGNQFEGSLDEIRIWNVARSHSQIAASRNVGLIGNEPGLVGYWRFDEGTGQTASNSATSAASLGSSINGQLGSTNSPGSDDPTWLSSGLPLIPYCPPCPNPPCLGQSNSLCASLLVNGIGSSGQGPFNVAAAPNGNLTFLWSGPPNQPYALYGSSNFTVGQVLTPNPAFIVDVNIFSMNPVFGATSPFLGLIYSTNAAGTSSQTFTLPSTLPGVTLYVQGVIFDTALTCSGALGMMTTAAFAIQL